MRPIALRRPPALAHIVEERIRDAIQYGDLALGEPVSEDKLATRLGVSRTPVREALAALQLQGLIVIRPQRGSFVFQPADQDIAEICEYRTIIETSAMALAMARDAAATIERLEAAEGAMAAAEAAGDALAAAKADAHFHNALIDHCGNSLIVQAYRIVSGRVGAIRMFARTSRGARTYSNPQHCQIIAALRDGRTPVALKVLRLHIHNMRVHFAEAQAAAKPEEAQRNRVN